MDAFIQETLKELPINNDNMVYAITKQQKEECISEWKKQTPKKHTPTKIIQKEEIQQKTSFDHENKTYDITKMIGKDLDVFLKQFKLKVSGKVQEKKERLIQFINNKE